jgi:hypothetical protein
MSRVCRLIEAKIMAGEYTTARMLGYSIEEALSQAISVRADFRRMCECLLQR